jgi:hypothetical protein
MADKNRRVPPTKSIETQVLTASQRKCCLCYYLIGNREQRKGQIAHLNRDPSNSAFENLIWLCLEHHDEFDSRTSQSKGLTAEELEVYRDRLYHELGTQLPSGPPTASAKTETNPLDELPSDLRTVIEKANGQLDYLLAPWKPDVCGDVRSYLFAYKASNRFDGICRIERIFLKDGRVAILCIAIPDNPGFSITNAVEELAFQVSHRFEIDPTKLIWIEHYPFFERGRWDLVSFQSRPPQSMFYGPTWRRMTEADWRQLGLRPRGKTSGTSGH